MGKKPSAALDGHVSGQSNRPLSLPAHSLSVQQAVDELKTDTWSGLDDAEAKRRLEDYGANELGEAEGVSAIKILVAQVANAMTMVLILAMAVSFGIGSWIEGGVVTFVILLNVVVGYVYSKYEVRVRHALTSRLLDSFRSGLQKRLWTRCDLSVHRPLA